jgi:hypothetical protein
MKDVIKEFITKDVVKEAGNWTHMIQDSRAYSWCSKDIKIKSKIMIYKVYFSLFLWHNFHEQTN